MSVQVIDQVPASDVARVIQEAKDAGATDVKSTPNDNGTWKVTATFPD